MNWEDRTSGPEGVRLVEFANRESLTQWVDKPIRGINILDLVFSTEDNLVSDLTVGEKLGKSDRNIVRLNVAIPYARVEYVCTRLDFHKAKFVNLCEGIRNIMISVDRDKDHSWNMYKTRLMDEQNSCIPNRRSTLSGKQQPKWYNRDMGKAIKDRKRSHSMGH